MSRSSVVINRRQMRAQVVSHHVMHALEPFIDILQRRDPKGQYRREIYGVLFNLFFATGVEVITDADRAAAGLSPRNEYGLTAEEFHLMEEKLEAAMRAPVMMPTTLLPK